MPPVAAAFGAVAAGTATVASIATVVSTVGVGLSVVGKVTGSKTLTKIGGIMSLAGGVTALASSAVGAAGAAGAAGSAAEGAAGWVSAEGGAGFAGGMAADAAGVASGATDWISAEGAADYSGTEGLSADPLSSTPDIESGFNDARFESARPKDGGGLLNAEQNQLPAQQQGGYSGSTQAAQDNGLLKSDMGYGANAPTDTSSGGIKKWWDGLDARTKNTIMQAGGKAVGGLFEGWSAEQKMAFEREKYNLMQANANAQPTVAFKPVQPKTSGLLYAGRGA